MTRAEAIQKAIYEKLNTGQYPVFEIVPMDQQMPFIKIDEDTFLYDDTKTHHRTRHSITIHSWCSGLSSLEAKNMNGFILDRIDSGLTLGEYSLERTDLEIVTTIRDQDNSFHGIIQYEFTLGE